MMSIKEGRETARINPDLPPPPLKAGTSSPSEGLQMRLSVVMGQAGKVLGAETPLTQPSISGGPESSDPRQASSSPRCTC